MAKRKSTKRAATRRKAAPQHELPAGYWQQAAAVLLMACAVLIVVSWFGAGGPVLDWLGGVCCADRCSLHCGGNVSR